MSEKRGKVTERSLYPAIIDLLKKRGAEGVEEIKYESQPDIIADWLGARWIISIKIGNYTKSMFFKNAMIQYARHIIDSGLKYGMIIFLPESIRNISVEEKALYNAIRNKKAYVILDTPETQKEFLDTLPNIFEEVERILKEKIKSTYSLKTVITLLKEQINDIMKETRITEKEMTNIITSDELFLGISASKHKDIKVIKFISTYIFLTQVLFARLYGVEHPAILSGFDIRNITKEGIRELFRRITEINYRPIYKFDILDTIPEHYIKDTFTLIWNLKIENIRFELPGRLFHELMPKEIKKMLAAFYTRPIAAEILSCVTINNAEEVVFDPACGSGTILTAAYRRKRELWNKQEDPHKLFCEEQIYGTDIMPFAVNLTTANLASLNPKITIEKMNIARADSLKLELNVPIKNGLSKLERYGIPISSNIKSKNMQGDEYDMVLDLMDVVLMNPPFTKIERGVKKYIKIERFKSRVGGEIGLWGHFIALADMILKPNGMFGGVIPINILRGRESEKVRKIVFEEWLPLYVIKSTMNYGFSESSEYRDILIIAKKTKSKPINHKVKFVLIKKDLNSLSFKDVKRICDRIKTSSKLNDPLLEIRSYSMEDIKKHFVNMMWFISGSSFEWKDNLLNIIRKSEMVLDYFPHSGNGYFMEGYRPVPKGVSKFMFITRPINENRIDKAFLVLIKEDDKKIFAETKMMYEMSKLNEHSKSSIFDFDKDKFLLTIRTPVGLNTMDITNKHDYIAISPYKDIEKIQRLSGFNSSLKNSYWNNIKKQMNNIKTKIIVSRRINPYSPNTHLIAFFSENDIFPSNQVNVVVEPDPRKAKAVTVLLNSIFFLAYFFNLKEETTGRYIDIRFYDLYSMKLYPTTNTQIDNLVKVFNKFKDVNFPPLREQLDEHFTERYSVFWSSERKKIKPLIPVDSIKPHPVRLKFDKAIIKALNLSISHEELLQAYNAIINDMIITRGLKKD
ncbi:class I SAM-dependent DNA methyltransferase [Candidatus Aciduliprofundum boonei]|uniref:N-6 DNA methylase n=1 Tax=Aciduliprofundum boonei (strain DSM 19572 / T469) TaxID=439481 RepID=B5IAF3_ACIB4|nr:N-6 DNA methylase [Candidatus Aciduliprofundum boonei]ADD08203.1 N-6 DNA methylase [Aciduliprofundum boonei T469]EDY36858.1 N-6 DNA Methylase family [Aciduliprofundum boonei T469]HII55756.1 SAM-dependent DNA methyltransferase [Candidatus Aciduliprofundum boonei]